MLKDETSWPTFPKYLPQISGVNVVKLQRGNKVKNNIMRRTAMIDWIVPVTGLNGCAQNLRSKKEHTKRMHRER